MPLLVRFALLCAVPLGLCAGTARLARAQTPGVGGVATPAAPAIRPQPVPSGMQPTATAIVGGPGLAAPTLPSLPTFTSPGGGLSVGTPTPVFHQPLSQPATAPAVATAAGAQPERGGTLSTGQSAGPTLVAPASTPVQQAIPVAPPPGQSQVGAPTGAGEVTTPVQPALNPPGGPGTSGTSPGAAGGLSAATPAQIAPFPGGPGATPGVGGGSAPAGVPGAGAAAQTPLGGGGQTSVGEAANAAQARQIPSGGGLDPVSLGIGLAALLVLGLSLRAIGRQLARK
ncbi:MAG TPA: hypothetical protein VFC51_17970 [Chloroflexota bacterium]|nr:hypothetical protein [Chloroflexota bacterium]